MDLLQKVRIGKAVNNFIKNLESNNSSETKLLNQAYEVVRKWKEMVCQYQEYKDAVEKVKQ